MGKIGQTWNRLFGVDEDDFDEPIQEPATPSAPEPTPQPQVAHYNRQKVVPMAPLADKGAAAIVVYEPRMYTDGQEVANHLLNDRAVVVNFDQMEPTDAKRVVDFLTGAVFAMHGEIKRIGEQIFLVTPANFKVDGSVPTGRMHQQYDQGEVR